MGLAVSQDDFAAYQVARKSGKLTLAPPLQPVWLLVPALALRDADALPAGTKPYASALRNAEEILFTLGPQDDHLQVSINVQCRDANDASSFAEGLRKYYGYASQMDRAGASEPEFNGSERRPGGGNISSR